MIIHCNRNIHYRIVHHLHLHHLHQEEVDLVVRGMVEIKERQIRQLVAVMDVHHLSRQPKHVCNKTPKIGGRKALIKMDYMKKMRSWQNS